MASLETNKILAAILTAGIIASGSGVISRILYHPSMPEENAYVIAVPEGETGGAVAEAEAAPLPVLLAAASPEEGESETRACAACHTFEQGGEPKIGPPLWGVVGRDIASVEGFAYSDALLEKEGAWSFDALSAFLENPKGWAPGTKMAFAGVRNPEERADVLVYLRDLSDSPVPLPEPETPTAEAEGEAAAADAAAGAEANASGEGGEEEVAAVQPQPTDSEQEGGAAPEGDGIAARLAHADLDAGERSARICAACHTFEEDAGAKIGPPLWGVVGREIASLEDFSYSDALAEKEGAWSYQALDEYLSAPREWAPGTKMAFVGVKKPEDRANLILYLRSLSSDPEPLP